MAIPYNKVVSLIDEKTAVPVLELFIDRAFGYYYGALRHPTASPQDIYESQAIDDAVVVALVLRRLMKTPDVRSFLGLKRKGRGEKFNVSEMLNSSKVSNDVLSVAEKYDFGLIGKEQALNNLDILVTDYFGESPKDDSTLERMLSDFVDHAKWLNESLALLLYSFDGDKDAAEAWAKKSMGKE